MAFPGFAAYKIPAYPFPKNRKSVRDVYKRQGEERRLLRTPSGMAGTRALPAFSGIFTVMNLPGLPVEVSRPLSLPAWSEESR